MNILKWTTILIVIFLLGGAASQAEHTLSNSFIGFVIGCCIGYVALKIADMEDKLWKKNLTVFDQIYGQIVL